MKIAMLRVGVDSGSGGIQGPLFEDDTFEYIPIPDGFGVDPRTYRNTIGRYGKLLSEYFPKSHRQRVTQQSIHFDPEFCSFTYGDPTPPKARLRELEPGDLLVFYCGLQGWGFTSPPALYIIGYFEVMVAGKAEKFSDEELKSLFGDNFHVKHDEIFERQKKELVLVKGAPDSRLLDNAVCISSMGRDKAGRPLKVLSEEMQLIFGNFDGKISFQRSPTRWVKSEYVPRAAEFVRSLK